VKPYNLLDDYWRFGGTCCFHLHGRRVSRALKRVEGVNGRTKETERTNHSERHGKEGYSWTPRLEAANYSETSVNIYHATRCHNIEDCNFDSYRREKLKLARKFNICDGQKGRTLLSSYVSRTTFLLSCQFCYGVPDGFSSVPVERNAGFSLKHFSNATRQASNGHLTSWYIKTVARGQTSLPVQLQAPQLVLSLRPKMYSPAKSLRQWFSTFWILRPTRHFIKTIAPPS
jgi:hypothetical protein